MFPYLTVDMVWIIVKSKQGSGFQSWHRDFILDEKIVKTIVVNLGSMKMSEVPGAAFGKLRKSPPEINNETMKGEGKIVMKKPTKVNLGSMKRSEVPGAEFVKLCKSPLEINYETMKGEGKSVMKKPTKINLDSMKKIEVPSVAFGELRKSPPEVKDETMKGEGKSVMNEPTKETDETVVDSSADGLEPLSCGVQTFLPSLTPVYQELHSMPQILPPSLPPIFKRKLPLDKWVCDKCDAEQKVDKMRCCACKSWTGGKRGALK
jgi:hypothetical protein